MLTFPREILSCISGQITAAVAERSISNLDNELASFSQPQAPRLAERISLIQRVRQIRPGFDAPSIADLDNRSGRLGRSRRVSTGFGRPRLNIR